jgi:hypothetical protein
LTHLASPRTWLACLATLALVGCASSGPKQGLVRAEDLLASVERVYVECELSNARARAALESMQSVVAGNFEGDGTESYLALVEAVEASSIQCEVLAETLDPLRSASLAYFGRWQTSLATMTNAGLRERSASRLAQARARCDAVESALQPAIRSYRALDAEVRDCATFLGNDLSAGSLSEIRGDVARLAELTAALDLELDSCLTAAQEYLRSAALPGQGDPADPAEGAVAVEGG